MKINVVDLLVAWLSLCYGIAGISLIHNYEDLFSHAVGVGLVIFAVVGLGYAVNSVVNRKD